MCRHWQACGALTKAIRSKLFLRSGSMRKKVLGIEEGSDGDDKIRTLEHGGLNDLTVKAGNSLSARRVLCFLR